MVFLDCGNIDRMPVDFLKYEGTHILNIDHHHDNTRFGTANLVVPHASCTAEIVYDLARELGARITPAIADAMYVGLVTDTGRFMYQNTTPAAHRMAADLIEAGVDTHDVYRRLYEDLPLRRLELLQRALASVQRYDDGAITMGSLTRADFEETGAFETDSEGIVDHMRSVEGTKVAVLSRELLADDRRGQRKVSLRATDGNVDVSVIARALGGGGHRQAAGASTSLSRDELAEKIRQPRPRNSSARDRTRSSSWTSPRGRPHTTSWPPSGASSRARRRSAMRARSTRSPPGCCWCWSGVRHASSAT